MSDVGLSSLGEVDPAAIDLPGRHSRPVRVLLVEDDPADARLLSRAVERGGVAADLTWVSDGEKALDLLRDLLERGQSLPDLVLLDLNMPLISGHEVLAEIRRDPGLRHLAVIILSTSRSPEDIQRAYADNANAFVRKPAEFEGFVTVLRSIEGFWFQVADLPGTD